MTIFKMYDGRHVDLSKIVAVGGVVVYENLPQWSYFEVWFQLMDLPLRFGVSDKFEGLEGEEFKTAVTSAVETMEDGHAALMAAWQSLANKLGEA